MSSNTPFNPTHPIPKQPHVDINSKRDWMLTLPSTPPNTHPPPSSLSLPMPTTNGAEGSALGPHEAVYCFVFYVTKAVTDLNEPTKPEG